MKTVVTRNGQITLSKSIRRDMGIKTGTLLEVHRIGNAIFIEKLDESFWNKENIGNFLPSNFNKILEKIKVDEKKRLEELGII